MIIELIFWISFGLIVYIYIGYFCLIWIISRFYPEPVYNACPEVSGDVTDLPKISLIVAAYNEEKVIAEKIQNCLTLDYPPERLEILIGSDGSTDKTNEILSKADDPRVKISIFQGRHGKNWALNQLVKESTGEIMVFTDAEIMFDSETLKHIIRPFREYKVGCVCGNLSYVTSGINSRHVAEKKYWSVEILLRKLESKIRTTFGISGAIYAIRSNLFRQFPTDISVADDTYLFAFIIKQGYNISFFKDAAAYAPIVDDIFNEMRRRIRICARNLNGIRYFKSLLHPKHGYVALGLWSHKIFRWFAPFPLIALFISTLFLASIPFYKLVLTFELAFIFCALTGILLSLLKIKINSLNYCAYFLVINTGLMIGFFKFLLRLQKPHWETANRP